MLKIREEQYEELGKVTLKRFEDEMIEHLQKFFPKYYEIYGEPLIRKVIQYGTERAEIYGFLTKRDTPLYIDLMMLLGSHFDQDPQYPWAIEILEDQSVENPIEKADKLYDRALKYLDEAAGKENEYLGRALLRIREIPFEDYSKGPVASLLQEIWPQKYKVLGGLILNALIEDGNQSAREHDMPSKQGEAVMTVLKYLLGSSFDKDLQFPWASSVLQDESITNPASKVDQLYKAAISYMNKWLS